MKEVDSMPICLLCGGQMTITQSKNSFLYSCHTCASGNEFHSKKSMFCPVCFHPLMAVHDSCHASKSGTIYLCSNLACSSYAYEERDMDKARWAYFAVKHTHFRSYLRWKIKNNYFRLGKEAVDFAFHNHLAHLVNKIIDTQGWIWRVRPMTRREKVK